MATRIAVIYYSSTGNTHALARAIADGAEDTGAEVRLRRVAELAPEEAIRSNDAWQEHRRATAGTVAEASLDDLEWADGFALGAPTRYGLVAAQLKQFIDSTGPLWVEGGLAGKAATAFTGAQTRHGGHETTISSLFNVFAHWGAIIVPLGYTSPELFAVGTPYGVSWESGGGGPPDDVTLQVARQQGARLSDVTALVSAPRRAAA